MFNTSQATTGSDAFPEVCNLPLLTFRLLRFGPDYEENEHTNDGETAPTLINVKSVVHEQKERLPRSQETFDILPSVAIYQIRFPSLLFYPVLCGRLGSS